MLLDKKLHNGAGRYNNGQTMGIYKNGKNKKPANPFYKRICGN